MIASFVLPVVCLIFVIAAPHVFKLRAKQIARRIDSQNEFFKAANALVSDETTPVIVLKIVQSLTENLNNPNVCRGAVLSAFSGKLRDRAEDHSATEELQEISITLNSVLAQQFQETMYFFVQTNTFSSMFMGIVARRIFFNMHNQAEEPWIIAFNILKNVMNRSSGKTGGLPIIHA